MVSCAPAPKPTQPDELRAVLAINRSLDSQCQDSSPPSQRALRRQISAVGAVCSNSARTDLCGGHRATGVPTATKDVFPAIKLTLWSTPCMKLASLSCSVAREITKGE